jgi:DNA-binding CsgD family transcriptional regulator
VAIPARTVKAMLRVVREAAFEDDLPAALVARLHEVVGADYVSYDEFRPDRAWNLAEPAADPEIHEAWACFGHQHPSLSVRRADASERVVRLSDVVSQRRLRQLELWSHVFAPLGIRHQLNVPLYESAGVFVGVGLSRTGGDFGDDELDAMELLRDELGRIVAAREGPPLEAYERAGLTRREAEVLSLAARSPSRAIAETLGISRRTVEKHLEHAYEKLGASSRHEAVSKVSRRSEEADCPA